jgi:hypothetical protein
LRVAWVEGEFFVAVQDAEVGVLDGGGVRGDPAGGRTDLRPAQRMLGCCT